ncbi:periplasmic protein conserved in bacteria with c-terminal histidine [Psychromonas ingrahamii 37]|uniref:Periplasmic protein conserved in bacteria with c-terminal histidine n=1 Tax=Psychromonas ingrahamii (strain DSM 17664 / CCUG 51855 / 37) TaxID=357804 RepID=A1T051_PSYIN|nr:copper chaperone PCu(A)C [Psychromonas ingrahamii]ABM05116.1 periplasmic protein conserved in bacteria with c-terminal histidine [Psychromonas ingrahamii 37]
MKTFISLFAAGLLLISSQLFAATLTVGDLYIRATPPNSKNSAAFMVIKNTDKKDIKLIAAGSDIADRVELHEHVMDNGLMKMRQVKEIIIKTKSSVKLQPGGYHVMFLNLKQPLKEGASVKLSLFFDNGQQLTFEAPIKKIKMQK